MEKMKSARVCITQTKTAHNQISWVSLGPPQSSQQGRQGPDDLQLQAQQREDKANTFSGYCLPDGTNPPNNTEAERKEASRRTAETRQAQGSPDLNKHPRPTYGAGHHPVLPWSRKCNISIFVRYHCTSGVSYSELNWTKKSTNWPCNM